MKKRNMALLIAVSMIATTLAACGGGGGASSQTTTQTTKADAGTTGSGAGAGGTSAAAPANPVKLVMYNNWSNKTESDPEAYDEIHNFVLENTGIDMEVIQAPTNGNDSKQKLSTMLAGGDQLDTWWGDWEDYYKDGIIIPINQYLDLDAPEFAGLKDAWESLNGWKNVTDAEGNIWGIPRKGDMSGYPVFIRNDWLEMLGMDMPATFDELNEYLYAVKELDPYGNGETVPLVLEGGSNPVSVSEQCFLAGYTDHGAGRFLDEDGKVKPAYLADGYIDFVKQIHQWYVDGIVHPEFMTHAATDVKDLVASGRAAATGLWYSRVTGQEATLREDVDFTGKDYEYILGWSDTGLIGPNGQLMQTRYLGDREAQVISSKCENPEELIQYIAWAYQPENQRTLHYGLQGKYWDWDPDIENAEEVKAVRSLEDQPTYKREFDVALGTVAESRETTYYVDGTRNLHNLWLAEAGVQFEVTTYNELEAEFIFDQDAIDDAVPTLSDVDTYRNEEMAKFIKGERSFDTWDAFIQDMMDLGLADYIEELTRQYNEAQ